MEPSFHENDRVYGSAQNCIRMPTLNERGAPGCKMASVAFARSRTLMATSLHGIATGL